MVKNILQVLNFICQICLNIFFDKQKIWILFYLEFFSENVNLIKFFN
jgi:hypothetical protein